MVHQILLIPGFFGFRELGAIEYFPGVAELLRRELGTRGVEARVVVMRTMPTSSLRQRAAEVLRVLRQVAAEADGPIHLCGHSTGGLDARLALCPTADLGDKPERELIARVDSLVTITTPHRGTPLAAVFAGVLGQPLLRLAASTAAWAVERPRLLVRLALKAGSVAARLDDLVGLKGTSVDALYAELLGSFDEQRRQAVLAFLRQVAEDQALVFQLTPDACDLLNAASGNPEKLRRACVVARASPLSLAGVTSLRYDVYAQALHVLFRMLQRAMELSHFSAPELTEQQKDALLASYGELPHSRDNDGLVPLYSQIWGELLCAVTADHLDVMGHYTASTQRHTSDWLPSGSGFDDKAFTAMWRAVAEFIASPR